MFYIDQMCIHNTRTYTSGNFVKSVHLCFIICYSFKAGNSYKDVYIIIIITFETSYLEINHSWMRNSKIDRTMNYWIHSSMCGLSTPSDHWLPCVPWPKYITHLSMTHTFHVILIIYLSIHTQIDYIFESSMVKLR